MARLVTLGETLGVAWTDVGEPLRTARTMHLSTAGAESTVAIGMHRLGHEASWIGVIGADDVGERVRRDLAAEGVDLRFVRTQAEARTGFMLRDRRSVEHLTVSYYRNGSAGSLLTVEDVDAAFDVLDDIAVLHVTGITPALSESCADAVTRAVERAHEAGAEVSFDVNYRATLPGSGQAADRARALVAHTDVLFVGHDEMHVLTGDADLSRAAEYLLAQGPSEVIIKRGPDGASAYLADGTCASRPAIALQIADVIGAGDSFVAGYLAARAELRPVEQRLTWGVVCAACTVGTHGDWEGLPTQPELARRSHGYATIR